MIDLRTPHQPAVEMIRPKPVAHPLAPRIAEPAARKRHPAYGKALYLNRVGGFHPARALVIFGDNWKLANETKAKEATARADGVSPYTLEWLQRCGWPVLALRPGEFLRGATEWNLVAGLWVHVLDQTNQEFLPDAGVLWMAAEVARFAAEVEIENDGGARPICDLANYFRYGHPELPRGFIPDWWSQELQDLNANNTQRWFANPARINKPHAREC